MYELKPLFEQRMKMLLPDSEDYNNFLEIIKKPPINSIRCNTNKISPSELLKLLKEKNWNVSQPFKNSPEIMIIESQLLPGELGKAIEHTIGYYYVQEISSMLPVIALQPSPSDVILDICAAPGSKTTQLSALMQNHGTIIANDNRIERIKILVTNLERCGCTNVIVTKNDAVLLCEKLFKSKIRFDKILLDVPCSGEGTLRSSPKTLLMWNIKMISKLSRMQKKIAASAVKLLKPEGEILYSTCTHSPEENESVVSFLVENFPLEIQKIDIPVKSRQGIKEWEGISFSENISNTCRIYPQDNNTEGFFLAKLKLKE